MPSQTPPSRDTRRYLLQFRMKRALREIELQQAKIEQLKKEFANC